MIPVDVLGVVGSPIDAATLAVIVEARLRVLGRLDDRLGAVEGVALALARSDSDVNDDLVERDLPPVDNVDVDVLTEDDGS